MQLTTAQLQTLKTWVNTNASGIFEQSTADTLNAVASPSYWMWRTSIDKSTVDALIDKASFTPTDAVPASGSTQQITNDQLVFQNRAMACQLKQLNAQWLTAGLGALNASVSSLRKNFQDCLRQIPSGASGANSDAGWGAPATPGAVRLAMMRPATVAEKLFAAVATGTGNDGGTRGTTTNPDNFGPADNGTVAEGDITLQNLIDAANS